MERPWMPFYVNDYSGDTALLSLQQHGAFCLLLIHYWTLEELPDDLPQLYRLCRCFDEEDKAAVAYVVGKYFMPVDGVLRNKRMDEEIRKAKEIAAKRSELGKKGNAIKYSRNSERNSDDLAVANGIAKASQTGSLNTSQNSRLSQSQSQPQVTSTDTKDKVKRFVPPSIEDVTAYCLERGKGVDPEKWYNHYTANGWKVGKNPMKDWRAAVRTWENGTSTTSKRAPAEIDWDAEEERERQMRGEI